MPKKKMLEGLKICGDSIGESKSEKMPCVYLDEIAEFFQSELKL